MIPRHSTDRETTAAPNTALPCGISTNNRKAPHLPSSILFVRTLTLTSPLTAAVALAVKSQREKEHGLRIVTQVVPAGAVYDADDYHQQYLEKGG